MHRIYCPRLQPDPASQALFAHTSIAIDSALFVQDTTCRRQTRSCVHNLAHSQQQHTIMAPATVSSRVPVPTPEEVKIAMAVSSSWPFPGSEDGWVKAHDAVRLDMADFSAALAACLERLKGGKPLQAWVITHLQTWWPIFEENVHHHHDNEEHIVIPELARRGILMPDKMSADHPGLMHDMAELSAMVKALRSGRSVSEDLTAFTALSTKFEALRSTMQEHLQEEEDVALPLMRMKLTHKQFKPIENKLVKGASLQLIGWLLRGFPNDGARRQWMTQVAGIPPLVQSLVMLPATRKFNQNVARLVLEVKAGQPLPREPSCKWF